MQWVKIHMVRDKNSPKISIRASNDIPKLLEGYYKDHDREEFVCICLDGKNKVIAINSVSVGSLSLALVHPREVFKPAILSNAAAVIVAHNHPSGDPAPSPEDRNLTKRLKEAGEILGINVLDHIVIGEEGRYYSFTDKEGI